MTKFDVEFADGAKCEAYTAFKKKSPVGFLTIVKIIQKKSKLVESYGTNGRHQSVDLSTVIGELHVSKFH